MFIDHLQCATYWALKITLISQNGCNLHFMELTVINEIIMLMKV